MIMEWLDSYEIRARIAPTIVVFSPFALLIILIWPEVFPSFNLIIGEVALLLFLIYALSYVVKFYGNGVESSLWVEWDGAPSTRFLRWRDVTFNDEFKEKIHGLLKSNFQCSLFSKNDEGKSPVNADIQISAAFLQVKAFLRKNDSEGLWQKHNAEYGFNRNLIGSRTLWLFFSTIATIVFLFLWTKSNQNLLFIGMILCSIEIVCSLIVGWYYLPSLVKAAADRYAESMWMAFSVISKKYRQ
jgi:hypothetical protein